MAAVRDADGQRVAIKYLSPRLLGDPQFVAAFRAEAALLRTLDVPYIVRLLEYVEAPGQGSAIIMELVDGVSLHEMITRQGPAGPEAALVVLKGSLLGLAAAHALGIVHRDYKPENVLVDGSGQSKLADFGVAVRAGQDAPVAGTPLYMAPEQWHGGRATPATDIYAASAVFFECLTGTAPFSGPPGQLAAQHAAADVPVGRVDEPLRALISRGMAKEPEARPGDAAQFLAELEATAVAAYGTDWESRGRGHLAGRAAALLLLLLHHGSAVTAGGTATSTTSANLPGSSQGTRNPQHPTHIESQHAEHVQHAEHLRHLEHLEREHAEHLEHVRHLEHAEGAGQSSQSAAATHDGGNGGQSTRRVSRPRPRLHLAVAGGAVVVVAAVAGVAVALSSHNGSGSSGGSTSAVNLAVTGTANSEGGNAGSSGTCYQAHAASSAHAAAGSNADVPAAPSNLTAQAVDTTSVQLTWTNNDSNQSGVVISLDGQQSVDLQGATVSSYTWTGLSPNTRYYFYVASKIYGTPGDPTGYGNTQSAWVGPAYASTACPTR